jgi:hypothetical protein
MSSLDAAMTRLRPRSLSAFGCSQTLRVLHRVLLGSLLLGLLSMTGSTSMAAEPMPNPNGMPQSFPVDTLSIQLSRQPGNAAYSPVQITLSGADGGTLIRAGKQQPFPYVAKELVALLNALFAIHFFDLPVGYSSRPMAHLNESGTVNLGMSRTSSASGNSVCVSVAAFQKCVRYGNQAPVELEQIVRRIFTEAERLTGSE